MNFILASNIVKIVPWTSDLSRERLLNTNAYCKTKPAYDDN